MNFLHDPFDPIGSIYNYFVTDVTRAHVLVAFLIAWPAVFILRISWQAYAHPDDDNDFWTRGATHGDPTWMGWAIWPLYIAICGICMFTYYLVWKGPKIVGEHKRARKEAKFPKAKVVK